MEKITKCIPNSLGKCEHPSCSDEATNRCMSHRKKIWNKWTTMFHYDCKMKIKDDEEYIETAIGLINQAIKSISDEGTKYGIFNVSPEFIDLVREMKERVDQFNKKFKENHDSYNLEFHLDELKILIKEVLESQVYHMLYEYTSKIKIWKKFSDNFDEEESISVDDLKSQRRMKSLYAEEKFLGKLLNSLVDDMKIKFEGFMQEYKRELDETKDRITTETKDIYRIIDK